MKRILSFATYLIAAIGCLVPPLLHCQKTGTGIDAPDSIALTLDSAQTRFVRNNAQLLASRLNIEGSRATIEQARLWSNPNLSVGQNIYNQETGKWFDVTHTGNTDVQIQQLFLLAGKRGKQVRLAEVNSAIAERTFDNLLRDLSFELRSDFFDLYFSRRSLTFYEDAIPQLQVTVARTEENYSKRSTLLSEVLRLKSLLLQLETDRAGIVQHIAELQSDLGILLRDSSGANAYYLPVVDSAALNSVTPDSLPLDTISNASLEHRPDYRIADANVESEEANLDLQKSLAIPDVTVGGAWSRAGGYIPNYFALTFSVDLPVFNRNQGNITQSEYTLESNKLLRDQVRMSIEREVRLAYDEARNND